MNNYRGWTIGFYAGQVPERCYSAERFDRKSGSTIILHAPSRVEIERAVDTRIRADDPCKAQEIELGI